MTTAKTSWRPVPKITTRQLMRRRSVDSAQAIERITSMPKALMTRSMIAPLDCRQPWQQCHRGKTLTGLDELDAGGGDPILRPWPCASTTTRARCGSRSPTCSSARSAAASASRCAAVSSGCGWARRSTPRTRTARSKPTPATAVRCGSTLPLVMSGWEVHLVGRIDGLRREDGVLVVEEIKSVRRSGQLAPLVREAYERQAAIYAWMLSRLENAPVEVELVLVEIGSETIERFRLEVPATAVEAGVRRRLAPAHPRARRRATRARGAPPGRRAPRLPLHRAATGAARDRRARRAGARAARAPAGRGGHRPGQDRGGALSGAALRAASRQEGVRPHRQEPAAGHGRARAAPAQSRERLPLGAPARQGAHVRQRPGDLPRGVLPVRARLLRQAAHLGDRRASARDLGRRHARRRLRRSQGGRGVPVRGEPRGGARGAGGGLRLQLRLRPLRGAHRVRRRQRPLPRHPGDRRGAQPGRSRPRLPLPRAHARARAPGARRFRRRVAPRCARASTGWRRAWATSSTRPPPTRSPKARPRTARRRRRCRSRTSTCCVPRSTKRSSQQLEERRETRTFRADDPFVDLYFELVRFLDVAQAADDRCFSFLVKRGARWRELENSRAATPAASSAR